MTMVWRMGSIAFLTAIKNAPASYQTPYLPHSGSQLQKNSLKDATAGVGLVNYACVPFSTVPSPFRHSFIFRNECYMTYS